MELINKIAKAFNDAGFELFEVGGSVRDSIMGRTPNDFDLTTNARPATSKTILEKFGSSVFDVGEKFGTVALKTDEALVEVTTYRKETYVDGTRKPKVAFSDSLIEDLSRRDFTINAIARNPLTGGIVDPLGGRNDITKKVIRCVGKDDDRFNEDPLRMLRAVRLAAQLGFKMEISVRHPEHLNRISKERIRDELVKMLISLKPGFAVRRLCSMGLMDFIIPEFTNLKNIEQGKNHIKDAFHHSLMVLDKGARVDHGDDDLVFRLACMLHDIGKPSTKTEDDSGVHFFSHHHVGSKMARKLLKRLKFENVIVDRVCNLIKFHMTPIMLQRELVAGEIKRRVIMRLIRKVGESEIYMLLDLVKCDIRSSKNARFKFVTVLTKMVDECMEDSPESLVSPINGDEIMKLFDLKPGQVIGKIKNHLTTLVVDGDLGKDDVEGAKTLAREYIKTLGVGEIM